MNTAQWKRRATICLVLLSILLTPSVVFADRAEDDFRLGVGFWRRQRWELAAETFEQFLQDHPDHPRASLAGFYLGLTYSSLRRYEKARERFEDYLRNNPAGANVAAARYRIAECSYYLGQFQRAADEFGEYLDRHPQDRLAPWGRLQRAESLVQLRQWKPAQTLLQELLQSDTDEAIVRQARYTMALLLEKQERFDDAVAAYRRVAQEKDSPEAMRALARAGTIRFRQEQYDEAAALYDELVRRFPDSRHAPAAALHSGRALYRAGRFQDALHRFGQVPADSSENAEALLFSGMAWAQLGRTDRARNVLQQAQAAAANDTGLAAEILFERARLERAAGQLKMAARMFADLADRWPEDPHAADALFNAVGLSLEEGQVDDADRLLNRLHSDDAGAAARPPVRILTGRVRFMQGKPESARAEFLGVLEDESSQSRDRALSLYYLARIDHEAGRFEEAFRSVQRLLPELTDENDDLRGALALGAMSALEIGRDEQAVSLASRFLNENPPGALAVDARAARLVAAARLGRYEAVQGDANWLIEHASDSRQTWAAVLQAAEAAWEKQDFPAAQKLFELADDPHATAAVRQSGVTGTAWCLYRQERIEEAAEAFGRAAVDEPDSPAGLEAQYMRVRCLLESGDSLDGVQESWRLMEDFLRRAGQTETAGLKERLLTWALDCGRTAARILAAAGRFSEADRFWAALADAFADRQESDEILDEWAWMHLTAERYDDSSRIYRRLLEQHPESPFAGTARLALAEDLLAAGQTDRAVPELQAIAASERCDRSAREKALYHLITISADQEDREETMRLAEQFEAHYSDSELAPQVQLLHAEALLSCREFAAAERLQQPLRQAVLEDRLEAAAWTEHVWILLGEAALAAKQYQQIDVVEQEYRRLFPDGRYGYKMDFIQARRWKNQPEPDYAKARRAFQKVIDDDVGRGSETAARSQFLIAETWLFQQDYRKAIPEFFRVHLLYRYPDLQARALFQAAGCQMALGQDQAAEQTVQMLRDEFPDSEWAEEAVRRLQAGQNPVP